MDESQMKNLKLNYHMLESCNYGCKFCFARYAKSEHLSLAEMQQLIGRIAESRFFSAINFAGGEPFLIKNGLKPLLLLQTEQVASLFLE